LIGLGVASQICSDMVDPGNYLDTSNHHINCWSWSDMLIFIAFLEMCVFVWILSPQMALAVRWQKTKPKWGVG